MDEQKLGQEIKRYQDLAKSDKKIDVASLALSAFAQAKQNQLSGKEKRWAYLISLSVPPVGLFFAVKFYFSGKDDGEEAAFICIILTVLSILVFVVLFKLSLSGSGTNVQQIEQIKPTDVQQLLQ